MSAARRLDVLAMERVLDEAFATHRFERGHGSCRVPGPAGHRRGLGVGRDRCRPRACVERDRSTTAGALLRCHGRRRRSAACPRRPTAGWSARSRGIRVRGRRPPRRDGHPLSRSERAGRAGSGRHARRGSRRSSWRSSRRTMCRTRLPSSTLWGRRSVRRSPLVGGPSSGAVAEDLGVIRLPDSIEAAVVAIGELIGSSRPRPDHARRAGSP